MELERPKIIIRHQITYNDLPDQLPEAELQSLYVRLCERKDSESRDALINAHMRMAWMIGNSAKRRLTIKKGLALDDLYAASYLGLVQGCEWIIEGRTIPDGPITPYLAVTCRRFVQEHVEHDHCVPIERRQLRKYYLEIGAPYISDKTETVVTPIIEAGIIMQESIAMFPEREQRVIHLLLSGYNQMEIGKSLELSKGQISKIVKVLQDRATKLRIFGSWITFLTKETDEAQNIP